MKHIEKIENIKGMPNLDCPYLNNDDYSDEELVINSLYSIIRTIESRLDAALTHNDNAKLIREDVLDLIDSSVDELEEVLNER